MTTDLALDAKQKAALSIERYGKANSIRCVSFLRAGFFASVASLSELPMLELQWSKFIMHSLWAELSTSN